MHNVAVQWQSSFSTGDVMPPAHPNCRCTAVIVPGTFTFEKSKERVIKQTKANGWLFVKHMAGKHDQKTHGSGGSGSARELLVEQAKQFNTFEEFNNAISLQGLRPKAWHIADEGFKLDPNYRPTSRIGGTSQDAGLFVGDPETWQDYASGRSTVIEYELTNLSYTPRPLADGSADFFADQSGNQGFFIRPSAFPKLKETGRFSLSEARERAKQQQSAMPKSKAEARQIWEESRSFNKHAPGKHDQKTHGKGGSGNQVIIFNEARRDALRKEVEKLNDAQRKIKDKYPDIGYVSENNAEFKTMSKEDQKKWLELEKESRKIEGEIGDISTEYFDNTLQMKSGNSPDDSDMGFENESFMAIRDEYVVPDEKTLKTNASLRSTGRVTAKVKRFDELVEQGEVKAPMRVYRGAVLSPEQVSTLEVGKSFVDRGFQSSGIEMSDAEFYVGQRARDIAGTKVLFEYDLQTGLNAVNVGYGEVVIQRGAKVTITGTSTKGDYTVIQAEVSKP